MQGSKASLLPYVLSAPPDWNRRRVARTARWMSWALIPLLIPLAAACSSETVSTKDALQEVQAPNGKMTVAEHLESSERAARRALRAERALRGARAMFTAEEAEVLVTASGLRVRFLTPLFHERTARFNEQASDRLGRLRAAIALFPNPKVVIHAPRLGEGSRAADVAQMRASEMRRALLRSGVASEDKIFSRLDALGAKALEVAVSNDTSFDAELGSGDPASGVASL